MLISEGTFRYNGLQQICCECHYYFHLFYCRYKLRPAELMDLMSHVSARGYVKPYTLAVRPDTKLPTPSIDYCPYPQNYVCDASYKYRSVDGSCNNLRKPILGRSMIPFNRLLPAVYGDGTS